MCVAALYNNLQALRILPFEIFGSWTEFIHTCHTIWLKATSNFSSHLP
jgi:hypothetical protein